MHKAFAPSKVPDYHPLMEASTNTFLRDIIASPQNYLSHVRRYSGSLTLNIVYGYEVVSNEDPFLTMAEDAVDVLSNEIASGGGIWLVDLLPWLNKIPRWAEGLPGMSFKPKSRKWRRMMEDWVDGPFEYTKKSMVGPFALVVELILILNPESRHLQAFLLLLFTRRRGDVSRRHQL
jgi:hypothetical protein